MTIKLFALCEESAIFIGSPRKGVENEGAIRRIKNPLALTVVGCERNGEVESIFVIETNAIVKVSLFDCW